MIAKTVLHNITGANVAGGQKTTKAPPVMARSTRLVDRPGGLKHMGGVLDSQLAKRRLGFLGGT